ncbi:flagellar hook-basal body complex protein FliE [Brevibacillus sp. SYP-B805]|nr:flagellar hook-basal body complex protein FliE [Brevibacillus sp. SYP-B805]NGQ94004.1 flagellar hook-basal body complex protein FliE [Brevibacillus sp. SYP-B805]
MELNRLSSVTGLSFAQQPQPATAAPSEVGKSFASYLADALNEVNQAQLDSEKMTKLFAAGQVEDIHQVMIASQKSTILLQTALQVRNKVIESYQEIMRMSI